MQYVCLVPMHQNSLSMLVHSYFRTFLLTVHLLIVESCNSPGIGLFAFLSTLNDISIAPFSTATLIMRK